MAFSNTPENDTYRTVPIKIDSNAMYRYGDLDVQKDAQIINMFYDRISQENKEREVRLQKRSGLGDTTYSLTKASANDVLRGSFNDVDTNTFYWAVNNKVYSVSPDVGTSIRTVTTLATSSGYVGFCTYLKADGTRYVVFTDGTELWVDNYVAVSCNKVTDVDLPTPHQPYPIYLNGYLFLIKSNTGDIYNSVNDDPTSWEPDEFISAEINSDYAERLFKIKNYIICLGNASIEYFWDAGNDTGSPLSRNDSPTRNLGYITGGAQAGDLIFFVGQDEKQNLAVYVIEGFKAARVSNSIVDRTLQAISSSQNTKGSVFLNKDGFIVSNHGHTFYVLVAGQTTWAFDIEEKLWYEWQGSDNTGLKIEASWGMYNGGSYLAIQGRTTISVMAQSLYQDFGTNFRCRYTTEGNTFGSMNWKVCNKLTLVCSQHNSSGTSNVSISWSDRDWSDAGSIVRLINIFSISPFVSKLGRFRRRSFRIDYSDNYPWFITELILEINIMGN